MVEQDRGVDQQVQLTDLLARNHIQGISVAHRRELFERAGWMDEHLKVLIDWDMWRRLAALAYPYHVSRITADHYLREEHGTSGAGHITHLIRHNPVRYAQMARRVMKKNLPCTLTEEQTVFLGELRKRADVDKNADTARTQRHHQLGQPVGSVDVDVGHAVDREHDVAQLGSLGKGHGERQSHIAEADDRNHGVVIVDFREKLILDGHALRLLLDLCPCSTVRGRGAADSGRDYTKRAGAWSWLI